MTFRKFITTGPPDAVKDVRHTSGLFGKKRKKAKKRTLPLAPVAQKEQEAEATDQNGPLLRRLADAVGRTIVPEKQAEDLRGPLQDIAVIAFVGSSGTGKSTRAIRIARQYQIEYIIDDGLLIHGSRIVAGTSAKRAPSRMESVRQALFADETRAAIIRRALVTHRPSTLMILGTSDAMLSRICENLWLNPPSMLIRIEDVSTEEEMRLAREIRLSQGKHTIPVPSVEIKHEFSGTFVDPLLRRRKRREKTLVATEAERTVVRPTFSALGRYSMSDEAMRMMVEHILEGIPGVVGLIDFAVHNEVYGVVLDLNLVLRYGYNAPQVLSTAQEQIAQQVETYTAINVMAVNVRAGRVVHTPQVGQRTS